MADCCSMLGRQASISKSWRMHTELQSCAPQSTPCICARWRLEGPGSCLQNQRFCALRKCPALTTVLLVPHTHMPLFWAQVAEDPGRQAVMKQAIVDYIPLGAVACAPVLVGMMQAGIGAGLQYRVEEWQQVQLTSTPSGGAAPAVEPARQQAAAAVEDVRGLMERLCVGSLSSRPAASTILRRVVMGTASMAGKPASPGKPDAYVCPLLLPLLFLRCMRFAPMRAAVAGAAAATPACCCRCFRIC